MDSSTDSNKDHSEQSTVDLNVSHLTAAFHKDGTDNSQSQIEVRSNAPTPVATSSPYSPPSKKRKISPASDPCQVCSSPDRSTGNWGLVDRSEKCTVALDIHTSQACFHKQSQSKKLSKKRKFKKDGEGSGSATPGKLSPNYFVAIQFDNPQIHSSLVEVQESIVQQNEKLKDAVVSIATLHLTLLVLHLSSEEDLNRAKTAMESCKHMVSILLNAGGQKLFVPVSGLSSFRKQVVFAEVGAHVDTLYQIAEIIHQCFKENGLKTTDGDHNRSFRPHLTIMKLSKAPHLRKEGVKSIKPELFEEYDQSNFGSQEVSAIQLCSMLKKKQENGYYHTDYEINLDIKF